MKNGELSALQMKLRPLLNAVQVQNFITQNPTISFFETFLYLLIKAKWTLTSMPVSSTILHTKCIFSKSRIQFLENITLSNFYNLQKNSDQSCVGTGSMENGTFELTTALDDCGTQLEFVNDQVVFQQMVYGYAIAGDLFLGRPTELEFTCTYNTNYG